MPKITVIIIYTLPLIQTQHRPKNLSMSYVETKKKKTGLGKKLKQHALAECNGTFLKS